MKIALLNLPFDNNYGGNLQRYALVKTLEKLGHEVVHIDLEEYYSLKWYVKPYSYIKRTLQKVILKKNVYVFYEQKVNKQNEEKNRFARVFYNKYIIHTKKFTSKKEVSKCVNTGFAAVIVGSDQVWRESMTKQIGIESYFLSVLNNPSTKRIAYAVSMGTDEERFPDEMINRLGILYSCFDAVSVREAFSLNVLKEYGWNVPEAVLTLDPTLLLDADDYSKLYQINQKEKKGSDIFCYLLDRPTDFEDRIKEKCYQYKANYRILSLNDVVPIEEWIKSIAEAQLVITDSYHGCVFSIIYRKPFVFLGNKRRGNARVASLLETLGINKDKTEQIDYDVVSQRINELKMESISFLSNSLK